jgi:hypothetical protein
VVLQVSDHGTFKKKILNDLVKDVTHCSHHLPSKKLENFFNNKVVPITSLVEFCNNFNNVKITLSTTTSSGTFFQN